MDLALILADTGASLTRFDYSSAAPSFDSKRESRRRLLEKMISHMDVLIDPLRPGVLEHWDWARSCVLETERSIQGS